MRNENIYEQQLDYASFNDQAFVTGDSPQDHDINTELSANAIDGFIDNTGSGDLQYSLSADGTTFGNNIYLPAGARDDLTGINGGGVGIGMDKLRVTWVADTSYVAVFRGGTNN